MTQEGHVGSGIRTPTLTNLKGSNFSGLTGQENRTYSIGVANATVMVWVDLEMLHKDVDFTYSGSTVTITNPLDDASDVAILYFAVP